MNTLVRPGPLLNMVGIFRQFNPQQLQLLRAQTKAIPVCFSLLFWINMSRGYQFSAVLLFMTTACSPAGHAEFEHQGLLLLKLGMLFSASVPPGGVVVATNPNSAGAATTSTGGKAVA